MRINLDLANLVHTLIHSYSKKVTVYIKQQKELADDY